MKTLFSKGFYLGIVIGFLFLILAIAFSRYLEIPYRSFNWFYFGVIILTTISIFLSYIMIRKLFTSYFLIFLIWFLIFLFLNKFLKFEVIYAILFSLSFILI